METKNMSFNERCSLVYPPLEKEDIVKSDPIGYPKVVEKVVDGKVTRQVEFVIEDDPKFNADDFAIENLLAAGVELQRMSYNNLGLDTIDRVIEDVKPLNNI